MSQENHLEINLSCLATDSILDNGTKTRQPGFEYFSEQLSIFEAGIRLTAVLGTFASLLGTGGLTCLNYDSELVE